MSDWVNGCACSCVCAFARLHRTVLCLGTFEIHDANSASGIYYVSAIAHLQISLACKYIQILIYLYIFVIFKQIHVNMISGEDQHRHQSVAYTYILDYIIQSFL